MDSIRNQASFVCDNASHEFEVHYSSHIERELRLLAASPQLDNFLMSSKDDMPINRAEVERLFLSLLQGCDICLSTTFLDTSGHEEIAVYGNKRKRTFRSLAEIAQDGPLGQNMKKLFMDLRLSGAESLGYTAPFYDAQNKLGILVGIAKREPEAGGFGGTIIQHYDLAQFIQQLSKKKVLDTPVVWIYGGDGKNLLSPPGGEVQQDPTPYLARGKELTDSHISSTGCNLFASDAPVMTVVCSIPPKTVSRQLAPMFWSVMAIFSTLMFVSFISAFLVSRWISGPIKELTKATENVSVEKLNVDLNPKLIESRDEIGILGSTFQKMLSNLKESTTSINNLNREITERKKAEEALEESEERFKHVAESAGDWIWEVNAEGLYTYSSPVVEKVLGYKPEEIIGKRYFYDFFAPDVKEKLKKAAFEAFARRESFKGFANPNIHKDGSTVIFETTGTPIVDDKGNLCGYRGADRDITNRKKAEQRQAQLLEQVEKTNQELKDFAQIVSHDLKAPLRGIKTLADWIATDYADKLDKEGREQVNLLLSRVERMQNLIDGVLQYSRVGRVKEEKVPVNLDELVPNIIDMVAPPENIAITVENELPVIQCDQTRIAQVFQNLLSNAIKYMDKPQGQVRIACVEEDGFWKFSVADNGPGIEARYFEKIFQMFQTLSPRDEFESTGVGLTVVKKIVEMYSGRIWVESKFGEGTTFFFTLPKQEMGVQDAQLQTNIAR